MNLQVGTFVATSTLLAFSLAACPDEVSTSGDAKATLFDAATTNVDASVGQDAGVADRFPSTDRVSLSDTYAPQDHYSTDGFVAQDVHSEDVPSVSDVAVDANSEDGEVSSDAGAADHAANDGRVADSNTPIPVWTCASEYFAAHDGCDCGCGIVDPDCPTPLTLASCSFNFCPSGGVPIATNPTSCTSPNGWLCDASLYGDGICDCGCGIVDAVDCADASVSSCHLCNSDGSCDSVGDCQAINPSNNGLCQ